MGRLTLNVLLSFAQFEREVPPSASATGFSLEEEGHVDGRCCTARLPGENRKLMIEANEQKRSATSLPAISS